MNKIIAMLMVVLGVASASADETYLWWFISDASTTLDNGWKTSPVWETAYIKAEKEGETTKYLNIYDQANDQLYTGATGMQGANHEGTGSTASYYGAVITDCTDGWTYYLEVKSEEEGWANENGLTYTAASDYISVGGTDIPGQVFDFGTLKCVPEPNSALLMIIGVAALGLRRRSKKA